MPVGEEFCATWMERKRERRGCIYLVLHEQDEPSHHDVDCIPEARILEQFGNLTSRETRKDQS